MDHNSLENVELSCENPSRNNHNKSTINQANNDIHCSQDTQNKPIVDVQFSSQIEITHSNSNLFNNVSQEYFSDNDKDIDGKNLMCSNSPSDDSNRKLTINANDSISRNSRNCDMNEVDLVIDGETEFDDLLIASRIAQLESHQWEMINRSHTSINLNSSGIDPLEKLYSIDSHGVSDNSSDSDSLDNSNESTFSEHQKKDSYDKASEQENADNLKSISDDIIKRKLDVKMGNGQISAKSYLGELQNLSDLLLSDSKNNEISSNEKKKFLEKVAFSSDEESDAQDFSKSPKNLIFCNSILNTIRPVEILHLPQKLSDSILIEEIGFVHFKDSSMVVIQALENTKPLDLGSVVCLEDKTSLGAISDTFGSVTSPFYLVYLNDSNNSNLSLDKGTKVFCDKSHSSYILDDNHELLNNPNENDKLIQSMSINSDESDISDHEWDLSSRQNSTIKDRSSSYERNQLINSISLIETYDQPENQIYMSISNENLSFNLKSIANIHTKPAETPVAPTKIDVTMTKKKKKNRMKIKLTEKGIRQPNYRNKNNPSESSVKHKITPKNQNMGNYLTKSSNNIPHKFIGEPAIKRSTLCKSTFKIGKNQSIPDTSFNSTSPSPYISASSAALTLLNTSYSSHNYGNDLGYSSATSFPGHHRIQSTSLPQPHIPGVTFPSPLPPNVPPPPVGISPTITNFIFPSQFQSNNNQTIQYNSSNSYSYYPPPQINYSTKIDNYHKDNPFGDKRSNGIPFIAQKDRVMASMIEPANPYIFTGLNDPIYSKFGMKNTNVNINDLPPPPMPMHTPHIPGRPGFIPARSPTILHDNYISSTYNNAPNSTSNQFKSNPTKNDHK